MNCTTERAPRKGAPHTHPLQVIRERAGMSRRQLATLAGVNYHEVYTAETGYRRIPATVLAALSQMGYDPDKVQAQADAWRDVQRKLAAQALCGTRQEECRADPNGSTNNTPNEPGETAP